MSRDTPGPIRPDVVLLHGLGSAASFWDNLLPALGEHYRVTAVNLPGHGPAAEQIGPAEARPEAMARILARKLEEIGIVRPHVMGLSLGGWVALEWAAAGAAASVVALAPAGLWRPGSDIPLEREGTVLRALLTLVGPAVPALAVLPFAKQLGLRTNVAHPERVSRRQFIAAAQALAQARGYGACDRAAVDHSFGGGASIDVPTTVAFGDADRVLPPDTSQERSLLPAHARFEVVGDCGHAMSWDQPEECLRLLAETVREASPADQPGR